MKTRGRPKKKDDELHSHLVAFRMTDEEYENFNRLIEVFSGDDKKISVGSFIRHRIFYSDDKSELHDFYVDVRGMRTDLKQALKRIKERADTDAYKNLEELLKKNSAVLERIQEGVGRLNGDNENHIYRRE